MTAKLDVELPHRVIQQEIEEGCNTHHHQLAPYACNPVDSRGRFFKEEGSNTRSAFRRDCDRIIHSTAFRRLEYKTQVFVNHEGDHYRTRLTHSLEVAQIARSISRNLSLNEDLSEALALAHDLGHTPFGHVGEEALDAACGNLYHFNHNAQSIKILTKLEAKYAGFDGLNLSWEVIEGIVKHNGPLTGHHRNNAFTTHPTIEALDKKWNLELELFPSAEAQIASYADDIAYNNHDIDDGIRAGLFTVTEVKTLPIVGNIFRQLDDEYTGWSQSRLIHEANRRMINRMVVDLIRQTIKNIESFDIQTLDDIRNLKQPLITFSKGMEANIATIKAFLHENMYHHYKVCRMTNKAKKIIQQLFDVFYHEPKCLPNEWRKAALQSKTDNERAEIVADFIAGMTDRFATDEYKKLFDIDCK